MAQPGHSSMVDVGDVRKEYERAALNEHEMPATPTPKLQEWLNEALDSEALEPNAMTLATVGPDGQPSARMVLIKGLDERGVVLYTNYDSRKGQELEAHPKAALVFYWALFERQVRVEGLVERLPEAESEAYFQSRPRGSQIGAWTSPQSQVIQSREELEALQAKTEARFEGQDQLPLPPNWGGYRVRPTMVEFWQGRPSRLHDRMRYRRGSVEATAWTLDRLAP